MHDTVPDEPMKPATAKTVRQVVMKAYDRYPELSGFSVDVTENGGPTLDLVAKGPEGYRVFGEARAGTYDHVREDAEALAAKAAQAVRSTCSECARFARPAGAWACSECGATSATSSERAESVDVEAPWTPAVGERVRDRETGRIAAVERVDTVKRDPCDHEPMTLDIVVYTEGKPMPVPLDRLHPVTTEVRPGDRVMLGRFLGKGDDNPFVIRAVGREATIDVAARPCSLTMCGLWWPVEALEVLERGPAWGEPLDNIADLWGLKRAKGEDDESFRARLRQRSDEVGRVAEPKASERTPLPGGWTWDPSCTCSADSGPAWVIVETGGQDAGMLLAERCKPPAEVLSAVWTEARRLGLEVREPDVGQWVVLIGSAYDGYLGKRVKHGATVHAVGFCCSDDVRPALPHEIPEA